MFHVVLVWRQSDVHTKIWGVPRLAIRFVRFAWGICLFDSMIEAPQLLQRFLVLGHSTLCYRTKVHHLCTLFYAFYHVKNNSHM